MTCGLWCLAMIWTDRKFLPKPYQMGGGLVSLNLIAGIGMAAIGLKAWWDYKAPEAMGKVLGGGWKNMTFLIVMVILSMIVTAIINSYYRSKQATS